MNDFEALGNVYETAEVSATSNAKPEEPKPGAYILLIKGAKKETTSDGKNKIVIGFDIAEGEYAGYYQALYSYESGFDKPEEGKKAKWKGTFDIWWPDKNDPAHFNASVSRLKAAITCINNSNPTRPPINPAVGLNLADFKGRYVGGAFGKVEWYFNGNSGWKVKVRWLASVDDVRAEKVKTPPDKPNPNKPAITETVDISAYETIADDGMPF